MAERQNSSGEHVDRFLRARLEQIKLMPRYTTIIHQVRSRLGLSNNEYCVFDSIDKLSNKPNHPYCTRSKDELAVWLEIGRRTVFRAIDVGLDKGLIEKNERGDLRTTTKWIETVNLYDENEEGN